MQKGSVKGIKGFAQICWKRKLDFLFLFYITSFIPIVSFIDKDVIQIEYIKNLLFSFGIAVQLFIISLLLKELKRVIFFITTLLFTLIPYIIILSFLVMQGTLLVNNNFFSIYETNFQESFEFVQSYLDIKVVAASVIYFFIPLLYIYKTKKESHFIKNIRFGKLSIPYWIIGAITIGFIFAPMAYRFSSRFDHIPFTSFYKNYYRYKEFITTFEQYDALRANTDFLVESAFPDTIQNKTYVIIIGESLTRNHMSLYGYPRQTTPLLDSMKNDLLVYEDVTAPQISTIGSFRLLLTFATNKSREATFAEPSIIELFNYAGYDTYWVDCQGIVGNFESIYGILVKKAKEVTDFTLEKNYTIYDSLILGRLSEILNAKGNKAIFLHLKGNHIEYKLRYPHNFEHFDNTFPYDTKKARLNDKQKKIINEYDNSVLYNDFVVSSVIDSTKKYAPFSYVLYFPDHGQEIFDIDNKFGHGYRYTKYMVDIPFILWRSDEYKKQVQLSEANINKPYTTEDVIYSISQLSGLQYEGYDSIRSIFSAGFKEKERTVGRYNYNDLIE